MYILGTNAYHPDSSACIIKDGQLIAAVEEERFKRIKHWAGFPEEAILYCLKEANLTLENIDYLALNKNPLANLPRKLIFALLKQPSWYLIKDRLRNVFKIGEIKQRLSRQTKIYYIEHHRSHLASAFFVSPFEKAAIVSVDGFGDFTSCSVARGEAHKIDIFYSVHYPHSLGIFYTAFTQFLGFKKFGDEYKVMGLSAYGQPKYLKEMQEILIIQPKGRFLLNPDYFSFYKKDEGMLWNNTEPVMADVFSERLIDKFGRPRQCIDNITEYHYDLAASAQKIYEQTFFHILDYAYKLTGLTRLCLAGGCALNSLANGKIYNNTAFKEVYIQPAASDAGGALGAGFYLYHQILKNKRTFVMQHAYWGPQFREEEIEIEIKNRTNELKEAGCIIEEFNDSVQLCRKTAEFIAAGKIIGWFQGRMEWGKRALGNRSILVDPRRLEMKDILNMRVKKREFFRPFAPSVLLEKAGEYFETNSPEPFMLKVCRVKPQKKNIIPAVTHVDGTARWQTVSQEENPLYWQLLKEFEKLTGVPVLLNTSFNENEPIVCKPQEAIDCFLRTKMDILVLANFLFHKQV